MATKGWWGDKIIITLTSDGERRHKKWCEHYCSEDKSCSRICGKCPGSATCEFYKPITKEEEPIWRVVQPDVEEPQPKKDGRKPLIREIYRLISYSDKLLGQTVMVKNTPYTFRIGEVVKEDFYFFSVEYGGRIHKYEKRTAIRNGSVYTYDETKCCFDYEEEEEEN